PNAVGEDTELGQRLTDTGRRILCRPEARGRHQKDFTVYDLIRNDFRKGVSAVTLELGRGRPVTDNRHSSPRDIAAVALACPITGLALSVPAMFATGLPPVRVEPLAAFLGILLGVYVATRFDLLVVFGRRGARFVCRAVPLMFILDFVR